MSDDTPADEGQPEESPNQSERLYQEEEDDDGEDHPAQPGVDPEDEDGDDDGSERDANDGS